MLYDEGDLEAAVTAALNAVADFDEDESGELAAHVAAAVSHARTARDKRIDVEFDVAAADKEEVLTQRRNLAREKKAITLREKALNKYAKALDARILLIAQEGEIIPPYKVKGGGTISLGSRVWARPEDTTTPDMTDEQKAAHQALARKRAIDTLKADYETEPFVKEDFNIMSVSSYFKEEVEHGRIKLDDNGRAVVGGLVISEDTTVSVRGV